MHCIVLSHPTAPYAGNTQIDPIARRWLLPLKLAEPLLLLLLQQCANELLPWHQDVSMWLSGFRPRGRGVGVVGGRGRGWG